MKTKAQLEKQARKAFDGAVGIKVERSQVTANHWNVEVDWDGEGNFVEVYTYQAQGDKIRFVGHMEFN